MFIRSERLFLRPGWPEDWQELQSRINDEVVLRNLASAPMPFAADDALQFLNAPAPHKLPRFLITLPSADGVKLIGSVGLSLFGEGVELGYWIAREHWGQGYATEAARAVLPLAQALGHRRIIASHFTDNPASGRVLVKAGFRHTGVTFQRHSLARGHQCDALEYVLELRGCHGGDSIVEEGEVENKSQSRFNIAA